ncbi:ribosomal protein S18 acetylase RimI-like enzyme [Streptomyces sp. CZ24]|nr:ribosomal protein S18 acetylase RimI-like enzyme [Streptomyces sp. CZ24]
MTGAALRPARPEDVPLVQKLARRTIDARYRSFPGDEGVDGYPGSGASDEHLASHFLAGHLHCLEAGGEIVGLLIVEGPTVDLLMIDVDRQRQGLGRLLLAEAERLLLPQYEEIRLETFATNVAAVAFYEACGWTAAGRPESEGPDRVEFRRSREQHSAGEGAAGEETAAPDAPPRRSWSPGDSVAAAVAGELALLTPGVRADPAEAARLLDPEFTEIGASGTLWTREAVLAALPTFEDADDPGAEVLEMTGTLLAPGWVQLRFVTVRGERRARRTSLWRLAEGGEHWRMYFHQGTPASDA